MIKIGILGSKGRMGAWVARLVETEFGAQSRVFVEADRGDSLESLLMTDVVIDFSSPEAMSELATLALKKASLGISGGTSDEIPPGLPTFVVGSTGWNSQSHKVLTKLAEKTSVLESTNFSEGIFLLNQLLKQASPALSKLGYRPVILETHHIHKKDAPSGTALTLRKSIDGEGASTTEIHSIRAGEVVGDHEVKFYGPSDQITLHHHAQDRAIFARGAIRAALWLVHKQKSSQKTGMYGMESFCELGPEGLSKGVE